MDGKGWGRKGREEEEGTWMRMSQGGREREKRREGCRMRWIGKEEGRKKER